MKTLFIVAGILIIFGMVLFVAALGSNGWDISQLSTAKLQCNTHSIGKDFHNISVSTDTTDVVLVPSDDGMCRVECYERENMQHLVAVKDQTLEISYDDTRKWYERISFFSFGTPKIMVYLPRAEYSALNIENNTSDVEIPKDFQFGSVNISVSTGDVKCCASTTGNVKIKTSTGDILAQNISAGAVELLVSTGQVQADSVACQGDVTIRVRTGKATLTNVQCKNLRSTGSTGDLYLQSVVAQKQFSIERSTGDVKLDCCDAGEIEIETDTGDVTGTLLSSKIFIAETDTGLVNVPQSTTGGRCEIETNTGNIKITTP